MDLIIVPNCVSISYFEFTEAMKEISMRKDGTRYFNTISKFTKLINERLQFVKLQMIHNTLKKFSSRKRSAFFWKGKYRCKRQGCPKIYTLYIKEEPVGKFLIP